MKPIVVNEPQHDAWLKGVIAGIIVLNVLDGILTLIWVYSGKAIEGNPLLSDLVNAHPLAFMLSKLALVTLGVILLWRLRRHPAAVITIFLAFLAYYLLLLYHLRAMNLGVLERLFERLFQPRV